MHSAAVENTNSFTDLKMICDFPHIARMFVFLKYTFSRKKLA
jgi:hypothetical protein